MKNKSIKIFTDGSCHTQLKIGAWAAIIIVENKNEYLKGIESRTTHNQMELMSVIKALDYVVDNNLDFQKIEVYSDSQYVVDIPERKEKLISSSFLTKAGKQVQNAELLKTLITRLNQLDIEMHKVISHQKVTENHNYNREVDIMVRKALRDEIKHQHQDEKIR